MSTQILSFGEKVIIKPLNSYKIYNQAETLIILTSTYGEGDPPSNANNFISLFKKFNQPNKINFSIIGFGSLKYPKFCLCRILLIDLLIILKRLTNDEINRRSVKNLTTGLKCGTEVSFQKLNSIDGNWNLVK